MTEAELQKILDPTEGEGTLIKAPENRDVAFYPIGINMTADHYELNGFWYSIVMHGIMGDSFGNPLREVIKIKKDDLAKWQPFTDEDA